ncbi:delta and Notch-like epidermal growth factor-related receptor [Haliotis rufescens]|uniref:delta and Notch-like epidermal growth factor-related receptor n=1 Tax=Haliotis rufescens TaxID=6454 RepID=UPI00201F0501|nr:delta and Notch-like epidermal growth factor-related receptor [Haliotis rufescens]
MDSNSRWIVCLCIVLVGPPGMGGAGDVCTPPGDAVVWDDGSTPRTVTVDWGYVNLTCHTVQSCFGFTDRPNDFIEPQLSPVEVQRGVNLQFAPSQYDGLNFPILPFKVDETSFRTCNKSHGAPVLHEESNQTFAIPTELLPVGVHYFIVDMDDDPLIRCEFGLRLNVTVKDNNCHHGDGPSCEGQGFCVTRKGEANFTCSCCGNFRGDYCDEYDSCLSEPCYGGGQCKHKNNDKRGFQCSCRLGYRGDLCEERVDDLCDLDLCKNNGTCNGNATHFTCTCLPGYTGSHCEVDVNECADDPCEHGGMCVDRIAGYECYCVPGYHGADCEKKYDECLHNPCLHNGACASLIDSYKCHCPPGYSGRICETKIELCRKNPCFNQSACVDLGNTYKCHCHPGFTGHHCEVNVNECASSPCLNGGTCHDHVNGYQCLCHEMHAGPNCQYTLDMFAPFLEGKPRGVSDTQHSYHVRNLYIVAGTLSGAILIVVVVLTGCYCRMHESYKKFNFKRLKYRRHKDMEPGDSTVDVSSVACPRLSIDAIWEATSLSYDNNQLQSPLHKESLKHMKI